MKSKKKSSKPYKYKLTGQNKDSFTYKQIRKFALFKCREEGVPISEILSSFVVLSLYDEGKTKN